MYKSIISIVLFSLIQIESLLAIELDPIETCGDNQKCLIVDTLEVNHRFLSVPREHETTLASTVKVHEAWNRLTTEQGCSDVADIVVGGTTAENGYFGFNPSSVPGDFAEHLNYSNGKVSYRCTLVVNYDMGGIAQEFNSSVEVGRRALTTVLNTLDNLRTKYSKSGPIRVWGASKGAAIVASIWYIEAHKGLNQIIQDDGKTISLNPCPSKNCYYMGVGNSYVYSTISTDPITNETAFIWGEQRKGYIIKPDPSVIGYWRLTQFTNASDPVYECNSILNCAAAAQKDCHHYNKFFIGQGYYNMIKPWTFSKSQWERHFESSLWGGYKYLGDNYCTPEE